jgi:hypothetical protein
MVSMLEREALMLLARSYRDKTGIGHYALGTKCGNPRLFGRLANGQGCNSESSERALLWFAANWPDDLPWPKSVYRPATPDAARVA